MIVLLILFLVASLIFLIVVMAKRLNKPKLKPQTETINIFGNDYVIDVSPEAQQKRKEEYEITKQNSWKENKEVDLLTDNGKVFYKTQRVNYYERELVGFYGKMIFSENKEYCVVFVGAGNDTEKGKVALVNANTRQLLYKIDINRPHKCKVSNNGLVACNDWNSREAKSTNFFVFDISGKEFFKQRVNSSVSDICLINNEGTYAAFDVLPQTELRVVDLIKKKVIKTIPLNFSTMNNFELLDDKVILFYNDSSKKEINI